MKSHHCQMTVSDSINAVGGRIVEITPTRAVVDFDEPLSKEQIIAAVETAGYKVANK